MKILIYVPLAPQTPRIFARCVTSVLSMQWYEPIEIVFGRNDMKDYPDKPAAYADMTAKYNRGRQMALDGGYDALMTIESDMIIPPLALERMTRIDSDVVYGLYVSRHGGRKWLAFDHITDKPYTGASLSDIPEEAARCWGSVRETKGVGMGCTLIHRHVLESIEFRCPDTTVANDWFFALDCAAHGFKQVHDLGVVCGHIQGAPDPKILWAEPNGKYSVQFFENGLPDVVQLSGGYTIDINKFGTTEIFPYVAEGAE